MYKYKMISSTYSFLYTKYDDTLYFSADKDISMKYIRNILKTNEILWRFICHASCFIHLLLNFLQNDCFLWRLFFLAWINKWNMYENVAKHIYKNKRLPDSLMLKGSLRFNLYGLCSCKTRSRTLTFRGHV